MAKPGFKPGVPPQARDLRTSLHTGATVIAVLSGICAIAAFAAGSPLQFGIALALFGAGWIATDFIEWTVEHERESAARRCAVPVARLNPGYGSCRVVYVDGGEHFSRAAPRVVERLAA